ncbi:hypothetical protein HS088_TW22G00263 [Tripterygium wilfordii]|uniref:Omega-hydroxypalmitate O-feruloyl transferase n=1 Tax=Tripterygium wilfordii TaxID=458696 RepID=A0A7J7BXK0_TRIWF|nr:omega-hydroxypalmitate O-feruloyl transferase-like [Tripterygium wilfordii]KAF5726584.1 hypothetical protein HS088_TW22G00263 [Tripterygium wilfordii]
MEDIKLVEKVVIVPENPTNRRRVFLSNIDLSLVLYQESVSYFDPPTNEISFSEACNVLYRALGALLVPYSFAAGRLVPAIDDDRRLEIDCNDAGFVVAAATTDAKLSSLGELLAPKPEFKKLVAFIQEDEMDLKDKPLLSLQLTQFECGSLALASRYNHCILDGVAIRELEANMAALTRGEDLVVVPNPDRTLFKARNPPEINHPHHEYSETTPLSIKESISANQIRSIYISSHHIANLKKGALKGGKLNNCTTFEVMAAKIWKARSIATRMQDEAMSTMLIPVDVRKRVVPQAPNGFAGNALVPAFARAMVREVKEEEDSYLVKKVQEGLERVNDEYVRSGIDWLEVHRGGPCCENSFSLVAWWRLGLEEEEFAWGRVKCATTITVKPGLVFVLPGDKGKGGLNICLELPEDQMEVFVSLIMEQ